VGHFKTSIVVTIIGFVWAYFLGGFSALYIVFLLSILEVSLSFDNAVVNAKVLETMTPVWQKRFITYGIPVAVFGMRFLFPLLIVAVAGGYGIDEVFNLALHNHEKYKSVLHEVNDLIYAFGGAFLFMVFLDFLFDEEREVKWIKPLESNWFIHKVAQAEHTEIIIALSVGLFLTSTFNSASIALAYFTGVLLHSILITFDELMNTNGVRNGLVGLLYLEVLDASFSFDGVIGAFALSSDIFIIMIGLGIGAIFVRSLTLHMVEKKTLDEYRYLEHGAHYAILALSLLMFIKMFTEINDLIVGTVGIFFIIISVLHSVIEKRKDK